MAYTDYGSLSVRAFIANEAAPIEGLSVFISGAGEENGDIKYYLLTDEDGVTESVRLPAPPVANSLDSDGKLERYSLYDVMVVGDGFYTKRLYNVPVFSGVEAILPVNMIAISTFNEDNLYPRGNVNAIFGDKKEVN